MTDEHQSPGRGPLAAEVAEAAERRRLAAEEATALALAERQEEAVEKLRSAGFFGVFWLVSGSIVLAVALKSFGEQIGEGSIENGYVVAMWGGAMAALLGLLLVVRAVVGWAVQVGMDASGR